MSNKQLFYFGCGTEVGHYLFPRRPDMSTMPDVHYKFFDRIDSVFVPAIISQGAAQFAQVGAVSIIAWHDYTLDKRPGSNSNIIGYGYEGTPKEIIDAMFEDFKVKFPWVYKRQPEPIIIKGREPIVLPINKQQSNEQPTNER
jgi:hypothetical protein